MSAPTAKKPGTSTTMKIIVVVLGLLLVAAVAGAISGSGRTIYEPFPSATISDATIRAEMVKNLRGMNGVKHDGDTPDIAVSGGVLFVTSNLDRDAASLCRTVAAFTNTGDTSLPLGVKLVAIVSGDEQLATCRP